MKKKYFTLSNITTWLLVAFVASMLIFPGVKAGVIRGLMTVGLFQPKIPAVEADAELNRKLAPPMLITNPEGQAIDVTVDLKGKVLFINFWATWCPPCIAEMPSIEKLYGNFKDNENVVFILVDADNDPQKSHAFMEKNGWSLPVYFPGGNIPSDYYTGTLPTTVIVNKNGSITYKNTGTADYGSRKMIDYIKELSLQ